ncbi:MAG TPA: FmdB family zinc ribbon protein [Bryobacteraceae bacterium]|nr:FmdB family zinc ribbon protein [Bryobacteraceae bacterium]
MPLYEYHCSRCDHTFEVMQKFSDDPLAVHEGCGGEVERLLSPPALQFKGSGWYVTDYARNGGSTPSNGKTEAKPETKSESKAETKTEAKAESKPAAKPSAD